MDPLFYEKNTCSIWINSWSDIFMVGYCSIWINLWSDIWRLDIVRFDIVFKSYFLFCFQKNNNRYRIVFGSLERFQSSLFSNVFAYFFFNLEKMLARNSKSKKWKWKTETKIQRKTIQKIILKKTYRNMLICSGNTQILVSENYFLTLIKSNYFGMSLVS